MERSTYQPTEHLHGSVERVTFHSQETGFCVLRVKVKGHRDLVAVIGNIASVTPGECIECTGSWVNDKKHGLQFKAQQLTIVPPTSLAGIEKYLGSGMVKGIGPHFAKKLVKAFGEAVFDVIENTPDRLTELNGIGKKRQTCIVDAWSEQKAIRNIMVFLQTHGVGVLRAVRIYKLYGNQAIEKVRENPYRLALDIHGVGFKTADALASRIGIGKDSMLRAQAGVHHVLQELCSRGHVATEQQQLIDASASLLEMATPLIQEAIQQELESKKLIRENINDMPCIFPILLHQAESAAAQHLSRLRQGALPWGIIDVAVALSWVEKKTNLQLSDSQKQAVESVLQNKLSIITGGPGVGKTTVVNSIIKVFQAKKLSIALCAPTGRAAKRLTETTGLQAKTIHRLLEFEIRKLSFKYHQNNPLPVDVLVIDESSMIDIVFLHHLLRAVPSHAALIFVGDADQLPSVGSGAVLLDMMRSDTIKTVRLTEIFRQAEHSKIIINAHRINQGYMPLANDGQDSDFYTIYVDTQEAIQEQLVQLVAERVPKHFQCDPIADIQVLTPMNRGGLGSSALNIILQKKLNGYAEPKIEYYGITFSPGDKVIQTVNNYNKEIFNGDIGIVTRIDLEENIVTVLFDTRAIDYHFNELDEINLSYAISIHKSQGSEFPIVIMPLAMQHYNLLARNLLYTGVTRGKQLVVLIGQKKAIGMAVKNNQVSQRLTNLSQRLRSVEECI